MNLREAAQQALEALEYHVEQTRPIDRTSDAITALRAALAQPQGRKTGKPRNATTRLGVVCFEAYARSYVGSNRWDIAAEAVRAALAQQAEPVQEPIGWFGYDKSIGTWFETNEGDDDSVPLYTTPPQRKEKT